MNTFSVDQHRSPNEKNVIISIGGDIKAYKDKILDLYNRKGIDSEMMKILLSVRNDPTI
jgi:hypothetical protein